MNVEKSFMRRTIGKTLNCIICIECTLLRWWDGQRNGWVEIIIATSKMSHTKIPWTKVAFDYHTSITCLSLNHRHSFFSVRKFKKKSGNSLNYKVITNSNECLSIISIIAYNIAMYSGVLKFFQWGKGAWKLIITIVLIACLI